MAISSRAQSHKPLQSIPKRGWSAFLKSKDAFTRIYDLSSIERSALVKDGAPAAMVVFVSGKMGISKERFVSVVGLPRSTVDRKIQSGRDMSADESERLVGFSKLIGQVEAIVRQSGNPQGFDAAKWFADWMAQPVAALGGRRPEELLDTVDGREAVSKLLAQMQSGAYA